MREALVSIVGSRGFVLPEFSTACRLLVKLLAAMLRILIVTEYFNHPH